MSSGLGLENWFTNFVQYTGTQKPVDLADVKNPKLEYAIWWTFKSAQVASVVGGLMVHPAYRYYLLKQLKPETTTPNSTKIIRNTCRRLQGRFMIASLAIAPLLSFAATKYHNWTRDELKERCYEIRKYRDGLVLDRSTAFFFFIGWYWKRFQGSVDAINISLVYATTYIFFLKGRTNEIMVDGIKPEDMYKSVEEGYNNRSALSRFFASKENTSST